MIIYFLTGGGHGIFDLTNFASHVCPSGELVSCVISMSSPNFHANSFYFNHSFPYKLLYYAWVTGDYISRKISPRNWFQCFPVYTRCCSVSGSGSVSGSVSGFRISWFSIRPILSSLAYSQGLKWPKNKSGSVVSKTSRIIKAYETGVTRVPLPNIENKHICE